MNEENKKAVMVLSGGMDSTTLLYHILKEGYQPYPITFDYGQKHRREIDCAFNTTEKLGLELKLLNIQMLNQIAPSALTRDEWNIPEGHYASENMKQTVVPNRNMVLLSLATAYAIGIKAGHIFYGAHAGDHEIYPDCRADFVKSMEQSIKLADWHQVQLHAPFLYKDKGDIVMRGLDLGVDFTLTQTCYNGQEKACGKCGSCTERLEAFKKAGVVDPIPYEGNVNYRI